MFDIRNLKTENEVFSVCTIWTAVGQSIKDVRWLDEKLKWFFGTGQKCPDFMNEKTHLPHTLNHSHL